LTLEYWLHQVVDGELSEAFDKNYFNTKDKGGSPTVSEKRTELKKEKTVNLFALFD
jgi:hypothetical protein